MQADIKHEIIPGTLIVGETGSGRAMLMRHQAARLFMASPSSTLFYFGDSENAAKLVEMLPKDRVAQGGAMQKVAEEHKALVIGVKEDARPNAAYLELDPEHAFIDMLSALRFGIERQGQTTFIVAIDDLPMLVPEGREGAVHDKLFEAFDSQTVLPILALKSIEELKRRFGFPNVYSFMRLKQAYILRSDMNAGYLELAAHPSVFPAKEELPEGKADDLPKGRVVIVTQSDEELAWLYHDTLNLIPESEGQVAKTGEDAATQYAVENWIVSNDKPDTILYKSVVEGFDFQIEFICREIVRRRTVFVNKVADGYVAVAWCDTPPANNIWHYPGLDRGERPDEETLTVIVNHLATMVNIPGDDEMALHIIRLAVKELYEEEVTHNSPYQPNPVPENRPSERLFLHVLMQGHWGSSKAAQKVKDKALELELMFEKVITL